MIETGTKTRGRSANARAVINLSFGASHTRAAELPEGPKHSLKDPFSVKHKRWNPPSRCPCFYSQLGFSGRWGLWV